MLYCPKCQQTYEEGTQRFCVNDETRLVPTGSGGTSFNETGGVFANILSRASDGGTEADEKSTASPVPESGRYNKSAPPPFRPTGASRMFKDESAVISESQNIPPVKTQPLLKKTVEPLIQESAPRFAAPVETPDVREEFAEIDVYDETGLTLDNANALIGQTIGGHYEITEQLAQTETSSAYLGRDAASGEKVLINVLHDDRETDEDFDDELFADERMALAEMSHPNAANVFDSGELPDGKSFVVSEYVEGASVGEMLEHSGQFNALRAARIIRQAAYALSEMHGNGILHRGLTAENIVLPVSDSGAEEVKVTNFGVSKGEISGENLAYKSPEQAAGNPATMGADAYSLAVIAFQMLTNRLPFDASTPDNLLKSQREGLTLLPTDFRSDIKPTVDEIIKKALAFDGSLRYPETRSFGDALFNAVTTATFLEIDDEDIIEINAGETGARENEFREFSEPLILSIDTDEEKPLLKVEAATTADALPGVTSDVLPDPIPETAAVSKTPARKIGKPADSVKATSDLAWEKRSPEPPKKAGKNWAAAATLAAIILASALGLGYYAYNRPGEAEVVRTPPAATAAVASAPAAVNPPPSEVNTAVQPAAPVASEIESPPPARQLAAPPDATYFENSKENLKSETAKNFLGFSLYYPEGWKKNDAKNNFLDISKTASTGTPVEQMLVSYYDSKGTFNDDKELFPALVKDTSRKLKSIVPNYKIISEGEESVNNGWRAYAVKFSGAGKTAKGENIKLWGKRLFIPAARNGTDNGYVLTLLATSLSPDVKSIEDIGVKGDLSTILYSFEPNQNY